MFAILFAALLIQTTSAQTARPQSARGQSVAAVKPTVKPAIKPLTLESTLAQAGQDYADEERALQAQIENAKASQYVPCDASKTALYIAYSDWYRRHAKEIFDVYNGVDELFRYVDIKVRELRTMRFEVLAISGQADNPEMTLQKVLSYLSDLNLRAQASRKADQYDIFKMQLANPAFSPFHLTLEQIIATVTKMTANMNASLKERGVQFAIKNTEKETGFDLRLQVEFQNGIAPYELNLLGGEQELSLPASEKWALVGNTKVDGYSIDAQLRYNEFVRKDPAKTCFKYAESGLIKTPYLAARNIKADQDMPKSTDLIRKIVKKSVCEFGPATGDGKVEFKDGQAKILQWGGTVGGWGWDEAKVEENVIWVKWGNAYGTVSINVTDPEHIISADGDVTCRFKF